MEKQRQAKVPKKKNAPLWERPKLVLDWLVVAKKIYDIFTLLF